MTGREPAWRLAIGELLETTEQVPSESPRSAGYLLTPLGARVNRCLLVGSISSIESRSGPDGTPFWRARLTDLTGSIDLSAGRFHPRAVSELRSIEPGGPAIVVGKANRFATRDGRYLNSVRVESLRSCSRELSREVEMTVADHLTSRLQLRERLLAAPEAADSALAQGVPLQWISGQREAIRRYPAVDPARFRSMLELLRASRPAVAGTRTPAASGDVAVRLLQSKTAPAGRNLPADPMEEEILVSTIEQLSDGSTDGYADFESVAESAARQGVSRERSTELVGRLQGEGILEEPLQGKLRRAA